MNCYEIQLHSSQDGKWLATMQLNFVPTEGLYIVGFGKVTNVSYYHEMNIFVVRVWS